MKKAILTVGRSKLFLLTLAAVWVAIVAMGIVILEREEFTPVKTLPSVTAFPHDSAIPLAADKPTLLLFAHPYCPCTRASLHDLDELLANIQNKVSVIMIFTIPDGITPGWKDGYLWKTAATMPGLRVMTDRGGQEARRFGVKGSGHTLLYSPSGKLLFSGGITESRGHEGDNPGSTAIASLVLHGHSSVTHTPVFGCSFF